MKNLFVQMLPRSIRALPGKVHRIAKTTNDKPTPALVRKRAKQAARARDYLERNRAKINAKRRKKAAAKRKLTLEQRLRSVKVRAAARRAYHRKYYLLHRDKVLARTAARKIAVRQAALA